MRQLTRILVAVAVVASLGACTDDDGVEEEPAPAPAQAAAASDEEQTVAVQPFDDWVDEVDAACMASAEAPDDDTETSAVDADGDDPIAGAFVASQAAFDELIASLKTIPPPDDEDRSAEAEAWLDLVVEVQEQLSEGVEHVDQGAWGEGLRTMDAAQPTIDAADEAALGLGLDSCAVDETDRGLTTSELLEQTLVEGFTSTFGPEVAECVASGLITITLEDGTDVDLDDLSEDVLAPIIGTCPPP